MVRPPVLAAVVALVSLAGLAPESLAQARSQPRSSDAGQRHHRPPRPTPPPRPTRPVYRGGNDAGGDSNVLPGSIAPRSYLGIGTSSRANIDLLNNPAANRQFPSPPVVVTPIPPRHDHDHHHHHWDRDDRARWWYYKNRDRHDHHRTPIYYHFPRETFVSIGSGLSIGGFGYPYPVNYPVYTQGYTPTVGVMNLPAPAIVYDQATGAYIYAYGNPYGPPLVPATTPAPAPATTPEVVYAPPRELTPMEQAVEELRLGMPDRALTTLRDHLKKNADDARAHRVLAVALLEQRRFDDAVASLRQAYRTDPTLADSALNAYELGYTDESLRSLVVRTVTYANRVNTGSSWLTVAALMQAEGRTEQARNALDKARRQGLEPEVLGAMKAALKQS
ncbi:MAG TPA: tetratricopeptide repeat protein [Phycisphaerales bacterium]|nr:tetratricopeptide repeat protein [Phycisphaerales bacterium]